MDLLAEAIEKEVNENGEVPAGALFISVKNTGDNPASFNRVTLPPGEAKSYPFVGKGYKAMSYQVKDTTLRILYTL